MKYKRINFIKLLKKYKSGWVAISSDFENVVFSGKTLKATMQKAKKYKEKLYYFPAGETYSNFVGLFSNANFKI
ncbi:hypothetical protein HYW55_00090 [Candidatus Gottesmanbacteria bacterium]|nr:hypothetical protein [Candidatus Gottesmanbacteria bacterium]